MVPCQLYSQDQCRHLDSRLAGVIQPSSGAANKGTGRSVSQRFGPIEHWSADYASAEASITLHTTAAEYACTKPAAEFRAQFTDVQEQVQLCHSITQTLKGKGGDALSFEAVLAAVNRAKAVKGYVCVRDAVLLSGPFLLSQVAAMQRAIGAAFDLSGCAFIMELQAEVRDQIAGCLEKHSGCARQQALAPDIIELDKVSHCSAGRKNLVQVSPEPLDRRHAYAP